MILVTGSSGMIGSALVERIDATGIDRHPPRFTLPNKFIHKDLHNDDVVLEKPEIVIHLAANARVWDLVQHPFMAFENTLSTFVALEIARKHNSKFILASSREIYGNGNKMPVKESVGSQRTAESSYSASKIFGEAMVWAYRNCYNLDAKIIRFSNVYGKYDFSDRFIPKAMSLMIEDNDVEIWGKNKVLDFTYIDDAIEGILHIIRNWNKEVEFNIATGEGVSLLKVARLLKKKLKSKSKIIIKDTKAGEVMKYKADISRMKKLGWKPKVGIEEGLDKTISWYIKEGGVL